MWVGSGVQRKAQEIHGFSHGPFPLKLPTVNPEIFGHCWNHLGSQYKVRPKNLWVKRVPSGPSVSPPLIDFHIWMNVQHERGRTHTYTHPPPPIHLCAHKRTKPSPTHPPIQVWVSTLEANPPGRLDAKVCVMGMTRLLVECEQIKADEAVWTGLMATTATGVCAWVGATKRVTQTPRMRTHTRKHIPPCN